MKIFKPFEVVKQNYLAPLTVFVGILISGVGCQRAVDDHEHDHGEMKTARITVWSDQYEVFAEHRAAVAGQVTSFITHVTDLLTLEPRREGSVKFMLRQGDSVLEHSQAAPARDGIYLPGIVFPKPGDWQLTLQIPTSGTNSSVDLGIVKVYEDDHAADHADVPEPPEGINFLKEQQWKIRLGTQPVARRTLIERVAVPAQARTKPGMSSVITAPVAGQVVTPAGSLGVELGGNVGAGDLLVVIKPIFLESASQIIEAEAEFAEARAKLQQAEVNLERIKRLRVAEAKSPRELEEAELALTAARLRFEAMQSFRSAYTSATNATLNAFPLVEVRSPIAGKINSLKAGPGEIVREGVPLFEVLNTDTLWIEAAIPELQLGRLSTAKGATFRLPGVDEGFASILESGGKFLFIGRTVDPETRTVPLIYEVPNPGRGLLPGQVVTLNVETGMAREALAIPETAVVDQAGHPVAFVQVSGETFEQRELVLGIADSGWVQVLDGLEEHERVVTRGAYAVRLASLSTALPAHGHAH